MKNLPIDISSFSSMITGNYIYVDKTEIIYNLFSGGKRLFFFSRPRRFGKSLLISTLSELFSANRKLFKGLWIDSSNYQWIKYPIIHLDFAEIKHDSPENFENSLSWKLHDIAKKYNISLETAPTTNEQLSHLIKQLAHINKVVILIDEYDKPILDHISDLEKAEAMKKTIASMYDVIKALDQYIHSIFVTSVTKFAKTSIFSGMNNLNDISLDEASGQLLGYTESEIMHYFTTHIDTLALKNKASGDEILDIIKTWYNGYRFSESPIKVYNPFSTLYYFSKQKLANYWFKSGTPTFLIHLIKNQYPNLEEIPIAQLKPEHLETFELSNIPLIPLLFQAGYLTISDYDHKKNRITLDYPNYEVKESFVEYIVASLAYTTPVVIGTTSGRLINALNTGDMQNFCKILHSLFARIPYTLRIKQESYYHSLFHFLMDLLILETRSKVLTNIGIIDTIINLDDYIYVFELKINKKPEEALQQIIDRKYYEGYALYNKSIMLVGLSFIADKDSFDIKYVLKKL